MVFSSRLLRWIIRLLRVALGGVFVYAAWTKLSQPWELFAMGIDSYQVLPLKWVELVARTLPWLELAVGALLIVGRCMRLAGSVTSVLLIVFFTLMVRAYAKGMEINCGCFGPGEMVSWRTLLRDGSLLAGSLLVTSMAFLRRRESV